MTTTLSFLLFIFISAKHYKCRLTHLDGNIVIYFAPSTFVKAIDHVHNCSSVAQPNIRKKEKPHVRCKIQCTILPQDKLRWEYTLERTGQGSDPISPVQTSKQCRGRLGCRQHRWWLREHPEFGWCHDWDSMTGICRDRVDCSKTLNERSQQRYYNKNEHTHTHTHTHTHVPVYAHMLKHTHTLRGKEKWENYSKGNRTCALTGWEAKGPWSELRRTDTFSSQQLSWHFDKHSRKSPKLLHHRWQRLSSSTWSGN